MTDPRGLPEGYLLNEYRIERVLGGGGFGVTYLAHDTNLDCAVALKEYMPRDVARRNPDHSISPADDRDRRAFDWGLQRFLLESRALASFHHSGIVRVLRYFRANDTAYMVMAYETGQPLQHWLVGRLPLDRASLLRIVRPLLDGLEAVHGAGFLHRDIKPGNIYIRDDGSPVLLDFGSARRVENDGGDHTLTAVVSPGFAPAEQYHRHGKQGPWTDLYALAGVMYWMVTGHLPMESLARLREDTMPSAARLGNAAAFGIGLLNAIDWALRPDEKLRPQDVAAFRRACLAPPTGGEVAAEPPVEAPLPLGLSPAEARTFIAAVLFADVSVPVAEAAARAAGRTRLARLLTDAVATVPPTTRLAINTREGCAVCYVGDPEDALRAATRIGDAAASEGLGVQMGINLGPVQVAPDAGGRSRILGDGISTACRVMRLAEPGNVLVSRAYFEVIQHLRRNAAACFRHLGLRRDGDAREHELFAYTGEPAVGTPADPSLPRPMSGADLTPAVIEAAERCLALHIGPMAKVLVRRTVPRAASREALHRQLAEMIPDPAPRAAFLASVEGGDAASRQPLTGSARAGARAPDSRQPPLSQAPLSQAPLSQNPREPLVFPAGLDEAAVARIEALFARFIGPMARVLLRRELRAADGLESLCRALAAHIDKPKERQRFLIEAGF
ncbi:protein kinase [Zoogloea sp.]|uniref:protein kinase domain-containing protein n=1 Tax=Zoogloea sp. TaxID=49181 RepID=UPI0035B248DC